MESIFRIHQASKTLSFSLSMPFSHRSVNPQNLSQAGQCCASKEPIFIPVQLFSQCPCSPLRLTNIMALGSRAQGIEVGETGRKVCRVAIFTNDPIFISHDDFRWQLSSLQMSKIFDSFLCVLCHISVCAHVWRFCTESKVKGRCQVSCSIIYSLFC